MRVKMPPAVRIVPEDTPQHSTDRGMRLLHREICCQGTTDSSPTGDVMTCRVCQRDFDPADFIRLIHHWAINCSSDDGPSDIVRHAVQLTPPGEEEDDACGAKPHLVAAALIKQLTPSIRDRENLEYAGPSPAPSSTSTSSSNEKRETQVSEELGDHKRKRPRVDAGANTTESGPWSYVCSRCKDSFESAWSLVRHVQEQHDVKIYEEDITSSRESTAAFTSSRATSKRERTASPPACEFSDQLIGSDGSSEPPHQLSPALASRSRSQRHSSRPASPSSVTLLNGGLTSLTDVTSLGQESEKHDENKDSSELTLDLSKPRRGSGDEDTTDVNKSRSPQRLPVRPGAFCVENILSQQRRRTTTDCSHKQAPHDIFDNKLSSPQSSHSSMLHGPDETELSGSHDTAATSTIATGSDSAHDVATPSPSERPRACEFCHKEFRFQSNLVVHRRIHTGERPYKCRICSHACTQSSKLKRHMKTHLNDANGPLSQSPAQLSDAAATASSGGEMSAHDGEDGDGEDAFEDDEVDKHDDDVPEDLSVHKSASSPSRSPASRPRSEVKLSSAENPSLVGELIDKFGLSSVNAYRDAYRQALQDSGRADAPREAREADTSSQQRERLPPAAHRASFDLSQRLQQDIATIRGGDPDSLRGLWLPPLSLSGHLGFPSALTSDLLRRAKSSSESAPKPGSDRPLTMSPDYRAAANINNFKLGAVSLDAFQLSSSMDAYKVARGLDTYRLPAGLDAYKLPGGTSPYKLPGAMDAFGLKSSPAPNAPATSTSMTSLSGPMTSPRRQRRDTCEYCGKVFKNGSNLTVHKRSHTGEKPYRCSMCNYACAQSSKLTRHMKTHGRVGKDVFQCRFCGMPFSVASTLEKHMRKCVVSKNSKAMSLPPVPVGR